MEKEEAFAVEEVGGGAREWTKGVRPSLCIYIYIYFFWCFIIAREMFNISCFDVLLFYLGELESRRRRKMKCCVLPWASFSIPYVLRVIGGYALSVG